MSTRILMIRHARTAWNAQRRIQGQRDEPLLPEGVTMAQGWAGQLAEFHFDGLICSDLCRAVDTAKLVAEGRNLTPHQDPRLREQNWGNWVGMTIDDVVAGRDYADQAARGWDFTPPGGESRKAVLARATAALEEAAQRVPGGTLLCVTHQGVLRCVSYHLAGHDMLPGKPLADKGYVVYDLRLDPGGKLAGCAVLQKLTV